MSRLFDSSCSMSRQRRSTPGQKRVSRTTMSSGQGPGGPASGEAEPEGAERERLRPLCAGAGVGLRGRTSCAAHGAASTFRERRATTLASPGNARTRVRPRARYAPPARMPSGPPPAAPSGSLPPQAGVRSRRGRRVAGPGRADRGRGRGRSRCGCAGRRSRSSPWACRCPRSCSSSACPSRTCARIRRQQLGSHAAHALIVHEGDEAGVERLVALYQTAWALRDDAMLGVMNPVTWMCLTTKMLAETMKPEFVDAVRASPAESLALWLGFVKLFKPDGGTWLVTRGGWLVGLPDLAWLATIWTRRTPSSRCSRGSSTMPSRARRNWRSSTPSSWAIARCSCARPTSTSTTSAPRTLVVEPRTPAPAGEG